MNELAGTIGGTVAGTPLERPHLLERDAMIALGLAGGWTGGVVFAWFSEAADTLRRMPNRERGLLSGSGTSMPMPVHDWMAYGHEVAEVRKGPPSAAAIDRLERVIMWCGWMTPRQLRIVWARAAGLSWRMIGKFDVRTRQMQHRDMQAALELIAWREGHSQNKS